MKLLLFLTFAFSVALCFGAPRDTTVSVGHRDFGLIEKSRALIQELITNMRNTTQQGVNAIANLSSGIQDMAGKFREKLEEDVESYRNRIREAFARIPERFGEIGADVRECIDKHRDEAEGIFSGILNNSKSCAEERINEIRQLIIRLKNLNVNATIYIDLALEEMRNCTENSQWTLGAGTCLGGVIIRTEVKGAIFIAQSGILITRINIALAALPSALEICAGSSIVEAGVKTAKIIMEVGSCSATSVFNPRIN